MKTHTLVSAGVGHLIAAVRLSNRTDRSVILNR